MSDKKPLKEMFDIVDPIIGKIQYYTIYKNTDLAESHSPDGVKYYYKGIEISKEEHDRILKLQGFR